MTKDVPQDLGDALRALRIERTESKPGRSKKRMVWLGALVIAATAAAFAVRAWPASKPVVAGAPPSVSTSSSHASVDLVATGYVVANRSGRVGAEIVGRIARTWIAQGDAVVAGAPLFDIDDASDEAELASANARSCANARAKVATATLAETELTFARDEKLAASGALPAASVADLGEHKKTLEASMRAATADANAASADARSLKTRIARHHVVAPFDAIIASKPAEPGDVVAPGVPLVELFDPSSLVVEIDVPEARLASVRDGAQCSIVLDALASETFTGHAARTRPRVDRAKATLTVEVRFDKPPRELRPDMAARVTFTKEN